MPFVRPARRVQERAVGQADLARPPVHLIGERLLAAGNALGDDDGGVVARLHDDAAQQIRDADPRVDHDEHLGAAHAPCFLAHQKLVVEAQRARLEPLEHHVDGHQLAHRRRRHGHIGRFFEQHRPGRGVDEDGLTRGRLDDLRGDGPRHDEDQHSHGTGEYPETPMAPCDDRITEMPCFAVHASTVPHHRTLMRFPFRRNRPAFRRRNTAKS